MITARPWAASSAMNSCTAALEPMSMPLVGSSRMMTRGLVASHLAITTFCWLPPESWPTSWSSAAARRSSRLVYSRARRNSSAMRRKPRREVRASEGRVTFWKIGRPITAPCLPRSSGT